MKSSLKLYFLFFIPLLIIYYPTHQAGFVTDFTGWQMAVNEQSFWEILNGKGYDIKSFYHFTHLLMLLMSKIFGTWGWGWYLVQAGLVALDAVLIYYLLLYLGRKFEFSDINIILLVGIAFWLSSPYISEVLVWRAAFHYPLVCAIHVGDLIWVLKFIETQDKKYVFYANSIYIISLFSLEYFFVTPFLVLAILILLILKDRTPDFKVDWALYKPVFKCFFLLPLVCIGFYIFGFHAYYGQWVSHSRQADAPFLFLNPNSYSHFVQYIFKHLFFIRHLDHADKEKFFSFFYRPSIAIVAAILIIGISILGLYFFKKLKPINKMLFSCFVFFSLWLIPVVSLHFAWILLTENDRYAFIPSAFLMIAWALCLSRFPKYIFYGLSIIYIGFSLFLTAKTNHLWRDSERIYTGLLDNFKWKNSENDVILLNVPDCLQGMYMFRHYGYTSAFPEAMDIFRRTNISNHTKEAMRYNMVNPQDGARVVADARDTIRVILNQSASWFMMSNWGVNTYETPSYKVLMREWDYQLILKPYPKKRILLYQMGSDWKVVDTTKIGIEQR